MGRVKGAIVGDPWLVGVNGDSVNVGGPTDGTGAGVINVGCGMPDVVGNPVDGPGVGVGKNEGENMVGENVFEVVWAGAGLGALVGTGASV